VATGCTTVGRHASGDAPELLRARSVTFALLARMLDPGARSLVDRNAVAILRTAVAATGAPGAIERLAGIEVAASDVETLAGRWVRWFDLGRVAPYEGSNVASNAGGVTPRLADVAGFYRAFGVEVLDERPDHVVAQLEFLALALLAEAEALEADDADSAEAAKRCARAFLRDHVGSWLDRWAARVVAIEDLVAWHPYAAAAADMVRAEMSRCKVIPLRDDAVLPADAGIPDDEEGRLSCEGELG